MDIWGAENGPWMLGLNSVYGIGAMLAPLIAKPFILTRQENSLEHHTLSNNVAFNETAKDIAFSLQKNLSFFNSSSPIHMISPLPHTDNEDPCFDNIGHLIRNNTDCMNQSAHSNSDPPDSIVYKAYFIVSCLVYIGSILCLLAGLLVLKFMSGGSKTKKGISHKDKSYESIPKAPKYIMISILFLFLCSLQLIEHAVFMFLFTFAVKTAGMVKNSAVLLVFFYMLAYNLSRALAALIIRFVRVKFILIFYITLTIGFTTTLCFAYKTHVSVLWVTIIGLGFSMAPLFACSIVFFGVHQPITPFVGGMTALASTLSGLLAPSILGAFFQYVGLLSFVYINLVSSLLVFFFFICLAVMGRKVKNITLVEQSIVS